MTKYYALIGPKLDGPALNSAMTACSIEPSIRQVPRLYVNRMVQPLQGLSGTKWLLFMVFGGKWLLFTVFGGK